MRPRRSEKAVGTCRVCGEKFDRRRYRDGKVVGANRDTQTCPKHRWLRRAGDVLVDKETRYQDDVACQLFVQVFRKHGGATLDAIAMALGVSRERVRQISVEALRKLEVEHGETPFGREVREHFARYDGRAGGPDADEDEEAADVELDADADDDEPGPVDEPDPALDGASASVPPAAIADDDVVDDW